MKDDTTMPSDAVTASVSSPTPIPPRKSETCPTCSGAEDGCCVCDHTGRVWSDVMDGLAAPENVRQGGDA